MNPSSRSDKSNSIFLTGAIIAPIAAFSASLAQAAAMSFAFFCITVLTVLICHLIPGKLPLSLRILLYSVTGCLVYIPTAILTVHLFPQVSGGIYVPLLSSAIYLTAGFQQYFQKKHKFRSLLKNLFSVIGTSLLTGTIRELLGIGSFAGIPLHFNPPLPILLQPAGGLILLVLMLILFTDTGRREA